MLKTELLRALQTEIRRHSESGVCELVSRNNSIYKSFAGLSKAVASLPVTSAIIDAEVVCLDGEGKSVFLDLMRKRRGDATLYAFDLLWLDGEDLRTWHYWIESEGARSF